MKKLKAFWLAGLLLLLCGLAGCSGQGETERTADAQLFAYYGSGGGYGLARVDGTMIVEPGDYGIELVYDMLSGKQSFAVQTESVWDEDNLNEYGQALLLEQTFNFYSPQGELLKSVTVELAAGGDDSDVILYQTADGDLAKARILVNELITAGRYRVLDTDGSVLVDTRAVPPQSWKYGYAYMVLADNFMAVDCSFNGEDWLVGEELLQFYDLNGEPMELAQPYTSISWLIDSITSLYSGYYMAGYLGEDGAQLLDILDAQGNVVLSGLYEVVSVVGDLFVVARDSGYGIVNLEGEWVYQEQPVG